MKTQPMIQGNDMPGGHFWDFVVSVVSGLVLLLAGRLSHVQARQQAEQTITKERLAKLEVKQDETSRQFKDVMKEIRDFRHEQSQERESMYKNMDRIRLEIKADLASKADKG